MRLTGKPVQHRFAGPCIGKHLRPSEKGRLVVTMMAAFSAVCDDLEE